MEGREEGGAWREEECRRKGIIGQGGRERRKIRLKGDREEGRKTMIKGSTEKGIRGIEEKETGITK